MLPDIPDHVGEVLWEGPLEADPAGAEGRSRSTQATHAASRDLPVVSIGMPQVWRLLDLYVPHPVPATLQTRLVESDYYLVRLACSFRPNRDDVLIDWARFSIRLLSDRRGRQPVAVDLHPLLVTQEVQKNVKIALKPSLKFETIEASLGTLEIGFEYPQLEPLISANGAGESTPSWDYEPARGFRLQGSKWMHLLVQTPKGMSTGRAILSLTADLTSRGVRIPVVAIRDRKEATRRLAVHLWGRGRRLTGPSAGQVP